LLLIISESIESIELKIVYYVRHKTDEIIVLIVTELKYEEAEQQI